ncbi:MAG: hypothetical protein DCC49_10180 [Acidobacteria bacterium]|nr:MAG: hypothetical protein DCC49_10180 [Acidobacteriota bacterium]
MKKGFSQIFKRDRGAAPSPLMPGEAADGEFEYNLDGPGGKRYDMARAYERSLQLADARDKLGLDEDEEIVATLDEIPRDLDEAAER